MSNKLKNGLLILMLVALVLVPGTSALPSYSSAGGVPCGTCHVNTSGGGTLNAVGINFSKQANYESDPKTALIAIGALPATAAVTGPKVTTNLTINITDVNETNENETNTTEIANEAGNTPIMPVNTFVEPATPVATTSEPAIPVSTPKPSPGFGIGMTIVVVLSIMYLFGKRR